jgi:hypothetical protein
MVMLITDLIERRAVCEPEQIEFMTTNLFNAIKRINKEKAIVLQAPTGSGKSFVINNYTIFETARHFDAKVVFVTGPTQENIDEPYNEALKYDKTELRSGNVKYRRNIRIYNQEELKIFNSTNISLDGDLCIFYMTTQFLARHYAGNGIEKIQPNIIFNDEAHRGLGVPDTATSKQDTGSKRSALWDPKWFNLGKKLMKNGCHIVHLTATPTNSQQMNTDIGVDEYEWLEPMPKSKLHNAFTDITYAETSDIVNTSLKLFKNQVEMVEKIQADILDTVWKKIENQVCKMMPAMMISLGRSGSSNGIDYYESINQILAYCTENNYALAVSTSNEKYIFERNRYIYFDRMQEIINWANNNKQIPLVLVVIESGKMGINIPRLTTVALGKIPVQETIHNNYSQLLARACRLPFFRNHAAARSYLKSLKVNSTEKSLIIEYYLMMNSNYSVLPSGAPLMDLVEEFHTVNTFSRVEGYEYLIKAFDWTVPWPKYGVAFDQSELNRLERKDHCEACPDENCFHLAMSGFSRVYREKVFGLEAFRNSFKKSLNVDHKDGNRFNNHPDNLITVCPNVHMIKTELHEDYKTRYDSDNKKIA